MGTLPHQSTQNHTSIHRNSTLERRRDDSLGSFSFWVPKNPLAVALMGLLGVLGWLVSATAWLTAEEAAIAAMAGMGAPKQAA